MSKLLRYFIVTCLLVFLVIPVSLAQRKKEEPPPFRERIFFGGNFGLTFGSTTYVNISPVAGYRVTPRLSAGVGIRYEYYKSNVPGYIPIDTHKYGGSLFSRFMIINSLSDAIGLGGLNTGIFLQGEYEILSLESKYFDIANTNPGDRFNLHSILVGGGLYQPLGSRSGLLLTVLWNLNETYNTVYANPMIRIGFNF